MKLAVLVSSDGCYNGTREDKSGKAIIEVGKSFGFDVVHYDISSDDKAMLVDFLKKYVEEGVNLVLTTGGTGFSSRDNMPEATKAVIAKEVPGIPEAIRNKSLEITDRAMLSRAVAGITDNTLIINLPGSEKAVRESLDIIMNAVMHGLKILSGEEVNCGEKGNK